MISPHDVGPQPSQAILAPDFVALTSKGNLTLDSGSFSLLPSNCRGLWVFMTSFSASFFPHSFPPIVLGEGGGGWWNSSTTKRASTAGPPEDHRAVRWDRASLRRGYGVPGTRFSGLVGSYFIEVSRRARKLISVLWTHTSPVGRKILTQVESAPQGCDSWSELHSFDLGQLVTYRWVGFQAFSTFPIKPGKVWPHLLNARSFSSHIFFCLAPYSLDKSPPKIHVIFSNHRWHFHLRKLSFQVGKIEEEQF